MSSITPRQKMVLDFVTSFIKEYKFSPSYEEIARALSLRSLATVHKHVTNLVSKGLLVRAHSKTRSIEIIDNPESKNRFRFETPHRLWDEVDKCYWIRDPTFWTGK